MKSKILHVVALSGGKDSTAMALRLRELNPKTKYVYICTPTGNELKEMFDHWRLLSDLLGSPLTPVLGGTLEGIIDEENMIPNFRARFCTRKLKIEPYAAWLMQQCEKFEKIVSYVGIRADEMEREAGDYTNIPGVESLFPMREWGWSIRDVIEYLDDHNIKIPKRTDCALCFYQRLGEWWDLWKNYPDEYEKGVQIETAIGHTFRSEGRDTWPASLEAMRKRFEAGEIPSGASVQDDMFATMKCRVCRM